MSERANRTDGLSVHAVVDRGEFRLDVSFEAAPGEVLGVLGPNGAGKSTLLRALAGLTPLTAGHISVDGEAYDDVGQGIFRRPNDRPVGLVFQNYRLFPYLSVRENVAFGLRSRGVGRGRSRGTANDWLARFGVTELADRKPPTLSGGQAQRVALARALAAEPELLLLDEPLAALDARTRLEVRAELRHHLADFPGPALLVTHDPLDAMVLTDRLLVIEDGRIVQDATPAQVARHPATQYVARLVGLNLYAGKRTGADPGRVELTDGGTFFVGRGDPDSDGRVFVALRPSAIALHTVKPEHGSPRNVWSGQVDALEMLTDRVRVEVTGTPPALVDITADAVAELQLTHGSEVWLSAKATDVDVYPDPTGPAG